MITKIDAPNIFDGYEWDDECCGPSMIFNMQPFSLSEEGVSFPSDDYQFWRSKMSITRCIGQNRPNIY